MLVGATARDILLNHVFGMAARRATHDLDFAVAVRIGSSSMRCAPDWNAAAVRCRSNRKHGYKHFTANHAVSANCHARWPALPLPH